MRPFVRFIQLGLIPSPGKCLVWVHRRNRDGDNMTVWASEMRIFSFYMGVDLVVIISKQENII